MRFVPPLEGVCLLIWFPPVFGVSFLVCFLLGLERLCCLVTYCGIVPCVLLIGEWLFVGVQHTKGRQDNSLRVLSK